MKLKKNLIRRGLLLTLSSALVGLAMSHMLNQAQAESPRKKRRLPLFPQIKKNDDGVPSILNQLPDELQIFIYATFFDSHSLNAVMQINRNAYRNVREVRSQVKNLKVPLVFSGARSLKVKEFLRAYLYQANPEDPAEINTFLEGLDLSEVAHLLQDDDLLWITEHFPALRTLVLPLTGLITSRGLSSLHVLTQLQYLDLSEGETLSDQNLIELLPLTHLTHLSLRGWEEITDAGLEILSRFPQLEYLDLSGCALISDQGLRFLAESKHSSFNSQMRHLNLSACPLITDQGLKWISTFSQLTYLNLFWCKRITDQGLKAISTLTCLQTLDLSVVPKITDAGIAYLDSLTQLEYLGVQRCKRLTEEGLHSLPQFSQLKKINWP